MSHPSCRGVHHQPQIFDRFEFFSPPSLQLMFCYAHKTCLSYVGAASRPGVQDVSFQEFFNSFYSKSEVFFLFLRRRGCSDSDLSCSRNAGNDAFIYSFFFGWGFLMFWFFICARCSAKRVARLSRFVENVNLIICAEVARLLILLWLDDLRGNSDFNIFENLNIFISKTSVYYFLDVQY